MPHSPIAPRLLRSGIVLVNPETGQVIRVIGMQYNPDTLSRTLQPQTIASDGHDRSQALRLKGPPVESIKRKMGQKTTVKTAGRISPSPSPRRSWP